MQKLNLDGSVQTFELVLAEKEADTQSAHSAQIPYFKNALDDSSVSAVWIDSEDDALELSGKLNNLNTIAINFPAFADGRSFSIARILREQLKYTGELIAAGGFMQDQLYYLKRCGFNAYLLADDAKLESYSQSLKDFSESYQAANDQPTPLFRRRG